MTGLTDVQSACILYLVMFVILVIGSINETRKGNLQENK